MEIQRSCTQPKCAWEGLCQFGPTRRLYAQLTPLGLCLPVTLHGSPCVPLGLTDITCSSQHWVISGQLRLIGSVQNRTKSKEVNHGRVKPVRIEPFRLVHHDWTVSTMFWKVCYFRPVVALVFWSDHGVSQSSSTMAFMGRFGSNVILTFLEFSGVRLQIQIVEIVTLANT